LARPTGTKGGLIFKLYPPLWIAFSVLEKTKENDGNVKKIK
jgi:hypothetical protein